MVAVAVAAVGLWGERMCRTSLGHRATASRWAARVPIVVRAGPVAETAEELAMIDRAIRGEMERRRDYFDAMRRKYERAARRPWLPVAPDPPLPAPFPE